MTVRIDVHLPDGDSAAEERLSRLLANAGFEATLTRISVSPGINDTPPGRPEADTPSPRILDLDSLTGLPGREPLERELDGYLERAPDRGAGVFVLDLFRFQDINKARGLAAGDAVLRMVAERLRTAIPSGGMVARLSGDTFAVVETGITDGAQLENTAGLLIEALSAPLNGSAGGPLSVTARVGAARYPADGDSAMTLIDNAHTALIEAKRTNSAMVQHYRSELTTEARRRLSLLIRLRGALARNEFHLLYQPQIDLHTGAVAGYEALLRWRDQEESGIGVLQLIQLLEETGLMPDVAAWTIDEVCRQLAAWRSAGMRVGRLCVNVSSIEFRDSSLVDAVRGSTTRHGVAPQDLMMEITESVLLTDRSRNLQILEELHRLGVELALDHFGTGYSSLGYLRNFPVDLIKIDRSFIDNVTNNPDDAAITRAIISMAHALNKKVVAEGVEKEAQLGFLRQQGCDLVQGYYFERPMAPADVERLERSGQTRTVPRVKSDDDAATVLVVDDDPNITSSLKRLLRRDGYRLLIANNPDTAFDHLALNTVDLVLADQRMPVMTGSELLSRVKHLYPDTVRIVLSGYTDLTTVTEAVNAGAIYKFITKPWDDEALRAVIAEALDWSRRKNPAK